MSARIISLADCRRHATELRAERETHDFTIIFSQARKLAFQKDETPQDAFAVLNWNQLNDWFKHQLTEETFKQKLFSRDVIMSIGFVSEMLTSFARNEFPTMCITDHLEDYATHGNPQCMLKAANVAFLIFAFWPETRPNRPLKYRKYAQECGPRLYASYGIESRKMIGCYMSSAFESLGNIAREVARTPLAS